MPGTDPVDQPIRWDHDLLKNPFIPRWDPQPIPTPGIFDGPTCCVWINFEWVSHVLGVLDVLVQDDAWLGTPEEIRAAQYEIMKLMAALSSPCEGTPMLMLRQSTTHPCHLEQSTDNGASWTTVYDGSLCRSIDATVTVTVYQDYTEQQVNIYNNNVLNIYPQATYDGGGDDINRDTALCYALRMLLEQLEKIERALFDAQQQQKQSGGDIGDTILEWVDFGLDGFGVAEGAFAAFAGSAGATLVSPYMSLGLAILGLGLGIKGMFFDADDDGATSADLPDGLYDDMLCCLYNDLAGQTISKSLFDAAFQFCKAASLPDTGIATLDDFLEALVANMGTSDDVFVMFLHYLNEAFTLAKDGVLGNDCEADCGGCATTDFTSTPGDWAANPWAWTPSPAGQWTSGVGWQAQLSTRNDDPDQQTIYLQIQAALTGDVTSVTVEFDVDVGRPSLINWTARISVDGIVVATSYDEGVSTLAWVGAPVTDPVVRIDVVSVYHSSSAPGPLDGYARATAVEICYAGGS